MNITKERTRILFSDFTALEKKQIDDLVGTMDKVFSYEDPDGKFIGIPTGMWDAVKKLFPRAKYQDNSNQFWEYATIKPVQHNANPRNQLQIDFIKFVLENASKHKNLAGILSPGTGKAQPLSTRIPTPYGYTTMGELKVGSIILGDDGNPTEVKEIYPQGKLPVYQITFSDGRTAKCCKDHLWKVIDDKGKTSILPLEDLLWDYKKYHHDKDVNLKDPHTYKYKIPRFIMNFEKNPSPSEDSSLGDSIIIANVYSNTILGVTKEETDDETQDPEIASLDPYSIPDKVFVANKYYRLSFLKSILDAAGNYSHINGVYSNRIRIEQPTLLSQLRDIAISIGCSAIESSDHTLIVQFSQLTTAYMNDVDSDEIKEQEDFKYLTIKEIQYIGEDECLCIKVSAENELYLTEDYIITHNTFMACYSAIRVGLRTLIIVPTSGIKVQWGETLTNMFKVPAERVKVVNSPRDFINVKSDFVVVSQASLASLNNNYDLEAIMKANKFGIKVIDEVQMWFHNIIKVDANSNICNNWYLTGTFGRSGEEENTLYQQMFGNLEIFREKDKKPTLFNRKPGNIYGMKPHMHINLMWGTSGISRDQVRQVSNSIRYSERAGKWMRYGISIPSYTELVIPEDGTMTKFLKDLLKLIERAENSVSYGRTLILGSTINTVEIVADHVRKMFPNKKIATFHSRNSKQDNDRGKAECDILISTVSSCGTGFDMKDLSKLIVFAAYKSWILADQVSGRLRRRSDGKDTYMWDFVDSSVPQLRAWANARADVFKRKSKIFKVIDM